MNSSYLNNSPIDRNRPDGRNLSDTEDMSEEDSDYEPIFRQRHRKRRRLLENYLQESTDDDSEDSQDMYANASSIEPPIFSDVEVSSSSSNRSEIQGNSPSLDYNSGIENALYGSPETSTNEASSSYSSATEVQYAVSPTANTGPRLRARVGRPNYMETEPAPPEEVMVAYMHSSEDSNSDSVGEVDNDALSDDIYNRELSPIEEDDDHSLNDVSHSAQGNTAETEPVNGTTEERNEPEIEVLAAPENESLLLLTEQPSVSKELVIPSTSKDDSLSSTKDEEGQTCPICFEVWSNAGEHRIVALKCGHLYGRKCIEKWLKGQGSKCPQCNTKVNKRDMINIYAPNMKVQDTIEKERLLRELEKLRQRVSQEEKERAQILMKMSVESKLVKKLRNEIKMLRSVSLSSNQESSSSGDSSLRASKLSYFQSFDLSKEGNCRVQAHNEWMNLLVVSTPSHLSVFPGFGVRKINTLSFKMEKYVPLHSKQIRDIDFNLNKQDLLLSVSLDKVAKISNMSSNATVISYTCDYPLWSCCWNSDKSNQFFVGSSFGNVFHFDTVIDTDGPINTYQISGSGPIVSLGYVPVDQRNELANPGLIITRLTTISFLEVMDNNEVKEHSLPFEGPFAHTTFDPVSRHFLTTCRPTDKTFHARHILFSLTTVNISEDPTVIHNIVTANEIHCFEGSTTMKVLSRNCLTSNTAHGGNCLALVSEESTNSVKVFDISTSSLLQTVTNNAHIVDILPFHNSDGHYVAFLADKYVKFHKWV